MDTKKLRQKILDLAIRGKLVPQDPNDEPASLLLERIRAEKEQLIKEGKIKRSKKSAATDKAHYENVPFEIPESWVWTTLGEISNYGQSENRNVAEIYDDEWVLELEDIEKDSAKIINYLLKKQRTINGIRHKFNKGEILFSKLRTYLNKVLIAPNNGYCSTEIIPFKTLGLSDNYICHFVRSQYFLDYTKQCGYGVKMPRLSTTDACKGFISLPPLQEQYRIVKEIERWFALIDQIEQDKIDLRTAIKQTKSKILDLAIHGKLVPQDPNDEPASELLKRINPKAEITFDNGHYEKLPKGWLMCQFGEYLDIRDGTHDSPKYVEYGYPFVTSKNLSNGRIDFNTAKFISEEDHIKYSKRSVVEDGDILFAMIGSIGNPVLVEKYRDFSIKNVALFKPHNRERTYMKYVLYYLSYIQETLRFDAKGGMQPFIPLNYFRSLYFPLPPLSEQHRIVVKFEEIFEQLNQIQESLEA